MSTLTITVFSAVLIGLGSTLMFDIWGLFLKYTFKIPPSNICLIGRWFRYMPYGIVKHTNIAVSPRKSGECAVGWMVHYLIGMMFATVFVVIAGEPWLQRPALIPAITFGVVTVLAPFFIMQPLFGFGVAASKAVNPTQARVRSVMNHVAFGFGLYFFGWLVRWLLWSYPFN